MEQSIRIKCCKQSIEKDVIVDKLSRSTVLHCISCTEKWTEDILIEYVGKDNADIVMKKRTDLLERIVQMRNELHSKVKTVLLKYGLINTEDSVRDLQDISTGDSTVRRLITNFISIDEERDCTWFSTEHFQAEYESYLKIWHDTGYSDYSLFSEDNDIDRELYDKLLTDILGAGVHNRCWMCRGILVVPDNAYCITCEYCKANISVDSILQMFQYEGHEPWYY